MLSPNLRSEKICFCSTNNLGSAFSLALSFCEMHTSLGCVFERSNATSAQAARQGMRCAHILQSRQKGFSGSIGAGPKLIQTTQLPSSLRLPHCHPQYTPHRVNQKSQTEDVSKQLPEFKSQPPHESLDKTRVKKFNPKPSLRGPGSGQSLPKELRYLRPSGGCGPDQ